MEERPENMPYLLEAYEVVRRATARTITVEQAELEVSRLAKKTKNLFEEIQIKRNLEALARMRDHGRLLEDALVDPDAKEKAERAQALKDSEKGIR